MSDSAYKNANSLCIYWKDDTTQCKEGAENMKHFFQDTFGYTGHCFAIPSRNPQQNLRDEIISFMGKYGKTGSLIIIHYCGHGAPDSSNGRHQSVWCATRSRDSPCLDWHDIQPLLKQPKVDILLLIDSCYAAQAARIISPPGRKFQLLAACAMHRSTPVPGAPSSFTAVLIKQAGKLLKEKGHVLIPQLHQRMAKNNAGLLETPINFDLSDNPESTAFILKPIHSKHKPRHKVPRLNRSSSNGDASTYQRSHSSSYGGSNSGSKALIRRPPSHSHRSSHSSTRSSYRDNSTARSRTNYDPSDGYDSDESRSTLMPPPSERTRASSHNSNYTHHLPPSPYPPGPILVYQSPSSTQTYQPPGSTQTYQPPGSTQTYQPPGSTQTYQPPGPVQVYQPPGPVQVYQPPGPVQIYQPPGPIVPAPPERGINDGINQISIMINVNFGIS